MAVVGNQDPDITTIYNISILPSDFRRLLTIQFKEFINFVEDVEFVSPSLTVTNRIAPLSNRVELAA